MNIIVKFDVNEYGVFIPDGYIHSLEELRDNFLHWCHDQPETIRLSEGKIAAYSISHEKFIQYLNEVILWESTERAYLIRINEALGKRTKIIHF